MNSSTSFTISQSGQPFVVPNHLVATSIVINYVIAGAPDSLVISVEGIINASGDVAVLGSYSGTSNSSQTITLGATYDRFRVTATWTGGANVSVSGTLTSTGPGPTWSASSLPAVQNRPF